MVPNKVLSVFQCNKIGAQRGENEDGRIMAIRAAR
jgi:hypothetical protein